VIVVAGSLLSVDSHEYILMQCAYKDKVHAVYAATGNYTNTKNIVNTVTVNEFLSEFINKQYTKLSVHQVYILEETSSGKVNP